MTCNDVINTDLGLTKQSQSNEQTSTQVAKLK